MGSKLNIYGVGDVNLSNMMNTENKLTVGFHQVSLTNWSTTAAPQISLGSLVECDGALYQSTINESIGGSTADGTLYIKSVPSSSQVTFEYSTTAPVWDVVKQGWYAGSTSNQRYLNYLITRSSAYYYKNYLDKNQPLSKRLYTAQLSSAVVSTVANVYVVFDSVSDNTLNEFDSVNKRFSAIKTGYINLNLLVGGVFQKADSTSISDTELTIRIYKNGSTFKEFTSPIASQLHINDCFSVSTGDYLTFETDLGAATHFGVTLSTITTRLQITDY